MSLIKAFLKLSANWILNTFGLEIRRKEGSAEGFAQYLEEANRLGMDVNDGIEQELGWSEACPYLHKQRSHIFGMIHLLWQ